MTTTLTTYDIHALAAQMDRLFAGDTTLVDDSPVDFGHGTSAGHIGHQHDGEDSDVIGWYCDGGNAGHPVLSIHHDDIQRAGVVLAALGSASSLSDVTAVLTTAGVRYERLV